MIRTRFAPSPTGFMHVGNARSALYPYLVAKKNNGKFILRFEDTDQGRYVEGAKEHIYETLKWLGLTYDEGPDRGGEYGPYVQTERKEIYKKYAQKLIDKDLAYPEVYTPQELEEFRNLAIREKRPFLYRNHRPENPPKWDGKTALRFKITDISETRWSDAVMGELSAGEDSLDDFIILKADGLPTYNFAHIIDDYEMKITHVIRGAEYVSSTPKYLALYKALDIPVPVLASVPHILAEGGKKKLGKRDGAKDILEYKKEGFITEAVVNYLALLGWNSGTEKEIYTIDELIQDFSLERVQRSGARFDEQKLLWLNGEHIRKLSNEELAHKIQKFYTDKKLDSNLVLKTIPLVKERLKKLNEYYPMTEFLFDSKTALNNDERKNTMKLYTSALENTKLALENIGEWNAISVGEVMQKIATDMGIKNKDYFALMRLAITGKKISPPLNESMELLGKEECIYRLSR